MKNNKKSITSTTAFSLALLCGIFSFIVLCNEPKEALVQSQPVFMTFIFLTFLNLILYVYGWFYLVLALRRKERLRVIPVIFGFFSMINLVYMYLGVRLALQVF